MIYAASVALAGVFGVVALFVVDTTCTEALYDATIPVVATVFPEGDIVQLPIYAPEFREKLKPVPPGVWMIELYTNDCDGATATTPDPPVPVSMTHPD